ncbi:MAG: cation-translocating P-type ATPase, partial [Candidatus Hermodarchaeota archaeon]
MIEKSPKTKGYYMESLDALERELNTNLEKGIKLSELDSTYAQYGYNELPKIKKSVWKIYLAPIFNFLIIILLVSGIFIAILGSASSTILTFTVVIINSATVIIQQFRAQKALDSLRKIAALKAIVIRDGIQYEIPTREIIPGDLILLEQGAKVPADARIISSVNLTLDEAPLTGESEPVDKKDNIISEENLPIQKQSNMVFMGTYVHTGRSQCLVVGTGINTEIGKISTQLNEMGSIEEIPLTKKLNRLGYILGTIVIINLIILIIYKFTILGLEGHLFGDYISEALTSSILRAMNIMPINLPILTTLVLITGVLTMAQSAVIVKNLAAIESLGRVSVICTDKTGTITRNEMTVEYFWINNEEFNVSGTGYEPDGIISHNSTKAELNSNLTFNVFKDSIIVNNNAKLIYEDVKIRSKEKKEMAIRRAIGSPTEAALLVLAEKAGITPYDVKRNYSLLKEFSFSSELKQMTTVSKLNNNGKIFVYSKGAPEKVIDKCLTIEINGQPLKFEENSKKELLNKIQTRAMQGYRTLAVAYKEVVHFNGKTREEIENSLTFLGFLSILDPARQGVREA